MCRNQVPGHLKEIGRKKPISSRGYHADAENLYDLYAEMFLWVQDLWNKSILFSQGLLFILANLNLAIYLQILSVQSILNKSYGSSCCVERC